MMRSRPWLWIVIAFSVFVGALTAFVVIAIKNKEPEVPLHWKPDGRR